MALSSLALASLLLLAGEARAATAGAEASERRGGDPSARAGSSPSRAPDRACAAIEARTSAARSELATQLAEAEAAAAASTSPRACHEDPPSYSTVVRSRRSPRTAGEEEIDAQAVDIAPRRRSADDLLRLVPGVLISQHGSEGKGQQIFLRGYDAAHGTDVEVKVAGIPINERSNIHGHGYIDLNFVIPEVVRRVTVKKGPYQLDQGNFANAGTIEFELGVAEAARGTRVSYELGSTIRHRGVVVHAPKAKPFDDAFLALEAVHDQGFGERRGSYRASSMGQVRLLESKQAGDVDLLVSGYLAGFETPGALQSADVEAGRVDFFASYRDDTGGRSLRGLASLRHVLRRGGARLDHQLFAQYRHLELVEDFTGYLLDPVNGDRRLQLHKFGGGGYRFEYTRPLIERLILVTGLFWEGELVSQREHAVDERHATVTRRWQLGIAQHQVAGYAGLRWLATSWLLLEAGARVDLFTFYVVDPLATDPERARVSDALVLPSPRLLSRFTITEALRLFVAYGRGLRAPEARAVLAQASDADNERYQGGAPRISASDAVELGVRYEPRPWISTGATAFASFLANEQIYDHVSGINLDRGRTRRLGGEFDVRVRPRPWIELRTDLTLVDGRFPETGDPIPGAPPVLWTTMVTVFHRSGFRAAARLLVVGPRPLPHGATAHAYALTDLSLGYRVGRLQLDARIDNLFNSRWREGEYNYASWLDREQPRSAIPALHQIAGTPFAARLGATLWF
ncbi:MAG: TonB-dependent receptor [Myxococcales bacterium]|nr:TonB-dependent receptor [Myxococcales bacterium]